MTGRLGAKCPEGPRHMRNQWKRIPGRGASWCKGPVVDVKCFRDTAWCCVAGDGDRPPGGSHSALRPSKDSGFEQLEPRSDKSDILGRGICRGPEHRLQRPNAWGFTLAFTLRQFN